MTANDRRIHHRRSVRLQGYDYSQEGAYFVTISAVDCRRLFGRVVEGGMQLNRFGQIVGTEWLRTANLRKDVALDYFTVMPNHLHGVVFITNRDKGTARRAPTVEGFGRPVCGSLPTIVRSFKSAVTRRINAIRKTPGAGVWQRNYHEHIIRNEDELNRIRQYILVNPAQWSFDRENPDRHGPAMPEPFS